AEIEALARSVDDNGGGYFLPAVLGLFAPPWRGGARGGVAGVTADVTQAPLARAGVGAAGGAARGSGAAMIADSGFALSALKVDGGMTANTLLMQTQADVLNAPVVRAAIAETTCLGAAYAAGLAVGFWPDLASLSANWRAAGEWRPAMAAE